MNGQTLKNSKGNSLMELNKVKDVSHGLMGIFLAFININKKLYRDKFEGDWKNDKRTGKVRNIYTFNS
jgi:hypothetical protein